MHIVNPFWDAFGGSELRSLGLFKALTPHCRVLLWSPRIAHAGLRQLAPIKQIRTRYLQFPFRGTLVIVGVYFRLGHWVRFARPKRVILIYNTPDPILLREKLAELAKAFHIEIEVVFASADLRQTSTVEGVIETSLIDIDRFAPSTPVGERHFTIGRLSRSSDFKHHPDDAALYKNLIEDGCLIRIMGPSVQLTKELSESEGVTLIDAGEQEGSEFLNSIDCFVYRTAESWVEPWGRVVVEAMASGLPVVCESRGGYKSIIRHGENGFLFDHEADAVSAIRRLRDDPGLRERVGKSARKTVEALMLEAQVNIIRFYLDR